MRALFAVSGTLAPLDIEVAGIADLKDYASIQSYLQSLCFVSHVDVDTLSGDAVRFRLTMRGGAESLEHASRSMAACSRSPPARTEFSASSCSTDRRALASPNPELPHGR